MERLRLWGIFVHERNEVLPIHDRLGQIRTPLPGQQRRAINAQEAARTYATAGFPNLSTQCGAAASLVKPLKIQTETLPVIRNLAHAIRDSTAQ
jgi:hypothetical protein